MASSPAAIAIPKLGPFDAPLDSVTVSILTNLGDHMLKQEHDLAIRKKKVPPFFSTVPAYFKEALRLAYAELYLLDDNAIVLSYLNGTTPFDYPDPAKFNKALLMLPSPDLIMRDLDLASGTLAARQGRALGLI